MSDTIGRVSVPGISSSSATFPFISDYPYGYTRPYPIITHRFGSDATLASQSFQVGFGPRRFQFSKKLLTFSERADLLTFWNSVQGSTQSFIYNAPNLDNTTTAYTVIFETAPLSIQHLTNACTMGMVFIEIPSVSSLPSYSVSSVCLRFPSATLSTALLSQVQVLIPLIHIRVRNPAVPDIYLADRRCEISGVPGAAGTQLYLPRILGLGDPGSDVVVTQDIKGAADAVQFRFGNADRVMSQLVQDTTIQYATVDLCYYHVNTQTLIQFWKGIIIGWTGDGSPVFSIKCTDGSYNTTLQYPPRVVSHQCWKTYADGANCPWNGSSIGHSAATITAAGGDPTSCDFFFDSPNGCLMHGMSPYFGGHPAFPQSVVIKDDGTGIVFGIGRNTVTSTSITSDSMYDLPLPEIWANDLGTPLNAFWANCIVTSVRDESTFEDVLGIVGVGPIGGYEGMSIQETADGYPYLVCPLADGFPPQGFKVNTNFVITGFQPGFGLRQTLGADPCVTTTDFFSLGQGTPQHWDVPDPTYSNILTGQANDVLPYAAGTAVCEVRYSKSPGSGITPTTAESHSLQVPLSKGLAGWIWDATNNRSTVAGLINPFWVAINAYLRIQGLQNSDSLTQLATFIRSAVFKGDGTGAAEICDTIVPPIVGTGTELQWMFQGTITEFKPFRDWLKEILNAGCGYYSFEFGALKLGMRWNAVPQSSFTLANILYQSLTVEPAPCQFEYLKVDFANMALQYQMDFAEYNDKDHATYFGRQNIPLTSRIRQVGLATTSQGLRYATTRTREEIGGILRPDYTANPYIEWDFNVQVTFRTTILALEVEIGMVISLTHPDIKTYPGAVGASAFPANTWAFRITRWQFHRDYSITITARSVTDSMYDLEVGPKVTGVLPRPLPVLFYSEPLGQWAPYQVQVASGDALYPSEWTFDLSQSFTQTGGQNLQNLAMIKGKLPINQFIPNCGAPNIKVGQLQKATTGGNLTGGSTLWVQVCAVNAAGQYSAPSDVLVVQIPTGTNTNQFTITNILWPTVAGLTGYVVFATDIEDDLICGQQTGALTGSSPNYTPITITVTGPIARSTYGVPNPNLATLRVRWRRCIHGGVIGAEVTTTPTLNTLVSSDVIDTTGVDNYIDRVLIMIGRAPNTTSIPFEAFNITAFNPATGAFTLDRDPVAAGIVFGDVFTVGFLGYDNSSNPYVLTDAGLSNATNGHVGELPNDPNRIGNTVIVIKGTNRGASAKIVSNTPTSYKLDQPLLIDVTSVWIVVSANWEDFQDVPLNNADPSAVTTLSISISNYPDLPVLFGVFLVDATGVESELTNVPLRMLFNYAIQATRLVTGNDVMLPTDRIVRFDTSAIAVVNDSLASAVTSTTQTAITLTSGTATRNGTLISINTEEMRVESGGGTASIVVTRAWNNTIAATYTSGQTVLVSQPMTFILSAIATFSNQDVILEKISTDINYVDLTVPIGSGDTLDSNGSTELLLIDNSDTYGQQMLIAPGDD